MAEIRHSANRMVEDLFDEWQQAAKAAKERIGRFGCRVICCFLHIHGVMG